MTKEQTVYFDEYKKTKDPYDLAWGALLEQISLIAAGSRTNPRTLYWLKKLERHAHNCQEVMADAAYKRPKKSRKPK